MNKLTSAPEFEGKLVKSWTEDTYRSIYTPAGFRYDEQPAHQFVIDEQDAVLATVSDQYTLVQNRELISALDLAADELGLTLEPESGRYHKGRSRYLFQIPELATKIGNDPSETVCTIELQNAYTGTLSLKFLMGWFRLLCENGQIVGEIAARATKKHVGEINPYDWLRPKLEQVRDTFEVNRLVAETLANTFIPGYHGKGETGREAAREAVKRGDAHIVEALLAETADRYHQSLRQAMRENVHTIGRNYWALAQAVSEIATHRLQERANGQPRTNYNEAAGDWGRRQFQTIVEYARR